jgi:hypothetical protein
MMAFRLQSTDRQRHVLHVVKKVLSITYYHRNIDVYRLYLKIEIC